MPLATDIRQVVGCTVLPGYSAKVGKYLLRDCERTSLNYNPEFIAQGEIMSGFVSPDLVRRPEELHARQHVWMGHWLLGSCLNRCLAEHSHMWQVLIGEGSKEAGDRIQAIYERFIPKTAVVNRMSVERYACGACSQHYVSLLVILRSY